MVRRSLDDAPLRPTESRSSGRPPAACSRTASKLTAGSTINASTAASTILSEGKDLFFEGNAVGYGPARTKATLQASQAPYVKEAHSDFLATLLERGVIGLLGLLLLLAAIAGRCWRLVNGTLPEEYAAIIPRAWLLVTIAPVMVVASAFYEVLHFRHLWTWLGILAALVLVLQDAERRARWRRRDEPS